MSANQRDKAAERLALAQQALAKRDVGRALAWTVLAAIELGRISGSEERARALMEAA